MPRRFEEVPTEPLFYMMMSVNGISKLEDFPALQRIGELLIIYWANPLDVPLRHEVLCQAFLHCKFILKRAKQREKLGTFLTSGRLEVVQALHDFLAPCAMGFEDDLAKEVTEQGREEDHGGHGIQWYKDKAARRAFKLSFRRGLAYRKKLSFGGRMVTLDKYDTDGCHDAIEKGMSLYVMDTTGKIYCHGKQDELALKHSSFLAGGATLAAGTMRVVDGVVTQVSGRSGHYRPTVQQMLNLLERLRAYQVDLTKTTVYREYYKDNKFIHLNPQHMEPCKATELLRLRHWPTGEEHDSMRVL
jgi:hypothetical protein